MNNLEDFLHETIFTVQEKNILIDMVSLTKQLVYTKDSREILKKIAKKFPEKYVCSIELLLSQHKTALQIDQALSEFEQLTQQLPIVHIKLSYSPTTSQVLELINKLRKKLPKETLIDYSTDSTLGTGIQIDFNGKTYKKTITDTVNL